MSPDDDLDDVLRRKDALDRADRMLSGHAPSGETGFGASAAGWTEVGSLLDAARQPATADELAGAEAMIEVFTAARRPLPTLPPRNPMHRKLLTGKAMAAFAAASLVTVGAAAAATGHFRPADRPSFTVADDPEEATTTTTTTVVGGTTTTAATTTTTAATTTTTVAGTTTTEVEAAASAQRGEGPDPSGPAHHGLCTAWAASSDHGGKNLEAPPWRNMVQAAADAGQTVEEFCADVIGPTTTSTSTAGSATTNSSNHGNGHGKGKGHGNS